MGFAITWFAVPETAAEAFLARQNLERTGNSSDTPDHLINQASMQTGWRVIWYDKYECPFLRTHHLRELSRDHDILVCNIEEHSMDSDVTLWRGGAPLWRIHHNGCENGATGLDVEGAPPECLAAIRKTMEQQQDEENRGDASVDFIFEIPLLVAMELTGFKHDEECSMVVGSAFHELRRTSTN